MSKATVKNIVQHSIVEHHLSEAGFTERDYKDEIVQKLCTQFDPHDITMTVIRTLEARGIPLTHEIAKAAADQVKGLLPALLNEAFCNTIIHNEDIRQMKIGTVIKREKYPYGIYEIVILGNEEKDHDMFDDMNPATKCQNPYCYFYGQFYWENPVDHKLDYYCPKCNMSWHMVLEHQDHRGRIVRE